VVSILLYAACKLYAKFITRRISVITESLLNEEQNAFEEVLEWSAYSKFNNSWKDVENII
jgi:hypothetical protein